MSSDSSPENNNNNNQGNIDGVENSISSLNSLDSSWAKVSNDNLHNSQSGEKKSEVSDVSSNIVLNNLPYSNLSSAVSEALDSLHNQAPNSIDNLIQISPTASSKSTNDFQSDNSPLLAIDNNNSLLFSNNDLDKIENNICSDNEEKFFDSTIPITQSIISITPTEPIEDNNSILNFSNVASFMLGLCAGAFMMKKYCSNQFDNQQMQRTTYNNELINQIKSLESTLRDKSTEVNRLKELFSAYIQAPIIVRLKF
jgi:hypothetical protein